MTKTCKTCKWWVEQNDRGIPEGQHTCSHKAFVYHNEWEPTPPQDGLVYWDSEGYSASFLTGLDFGCVHWEAQ